MALRRGLRHPLRGGGSCRCETPIAGEGEARKSLFRTVALWSRGGLKLEVVLETVDQHERLRFRPFRLSGPDLYHWY